MTDEESEERRLTRRDAIAALAAGGVTVGAGATLLAVSDGDGSDADDGSGGSDGSGGNDGPDGSDEPSPPGTDGSTGDGPLSESDVETLVAAAEVLYPSDVDGVAAFVERFARGRARDRPEHAAGIADAVAYLDEYARAWRDRPFADLDPGARDELLRDMQVDTLDADPEGSDAERVRYYVRNELLFALFSSPTGGELVGIENPQGHPGGTGSYRRGPRS